MDSTLEAHDQDICTGGQEVFSNLMLYAFHTLSDYPFQNTIIDLSVGMSSQVDFPLVLRAFISLEQFRLLDNSKRV